MRHHQHNIYDIDKRVFDESVEALLKTVEVITTFDIPYTAGYSVSGRQIYIDRHLPRWMGDVDVHRYVTLHEVIEKTLLDRFRVRYLFAHQFATRLERDAVENDGHSWRDYDDFCNSYIKYIEHLKPRSLPHNLDIRPYIECESAKNVDLLRTKMLAESASYKNVIAYSSSNR